MNQRETPHPPQPSRALEVTSSSIEETQALGERLGRLLGAGDVVALYGELGSGKTTLVQGIARGSGRDPGVVKSPTFVLQREYGGEVPITHVDGYRLEGAKDVIWLDTDLIFSSFKITVIEWAERFEGLLPEDRVEVRMEHVSANRRRITVRASGPRAAQLVTQLHEAAPAAQDAGPAERP